MGREARLRRETREAFDGTFALLYGLELLEAGTAPAGDANPGNVGDRVEGARLTLYLAQADRERFERLGAARGIAPGELMVLALNLALEHQAAEREVPEDVRARVVARVEAARREACA